MVLYDGQGRGRGHSDQGRGALVVCVALISDLGRWCDLFDRTHRNGECRKETTTRECERQAQQQSVKSTGADMAVLQLMSTRTGSITVLLRHKLSLSLFPTAAFRIKKELKPVGTVPGCRSIGE